VKEQINSIVQTAIFGAIAAAAGVAAFLFLMIAAFLWTQQHYDAIVASGVLGGASLLIAVIALVTLAILRRRVERQRESEEAEAAKTPAWLADPALILAAIQLARAIGFGRIIPLAITGLAAFGLASAKPRNSKNRRTSEKDERRHAA
jgi:hypothetical protein